MELNENILIAIATVIKLLMVAVSILILFGIKKSKQRTPFYVSLSGVGLIIITIFMLWFAPAGEEGRVSILMRAAYLASPAGILLYLVGVYAYIRNTLNHKNEGANKSS